MLNGEAQLMSVMASTRLSDDIFLIGMRDSKPLSRLKQLPTIKQVLQRFNHYLNEVKSVRNASHNTTDVVLEIWAKAPIPTTLQMP